jgi:two-component system, chemotaxis family, CheB/CheR fusion protein
MSGIPKAGTEGTSGENTVDRRSAPALPFPVVGIGASAGGLEALQEFFLQMPDDPGAAFVVVQHLSPNYKSMMEELLSRHTVLPVCTVTDGMDVQVNTIYLIPPRKNMIIARGRLHLTEQPESAVLNLPIDIFLRSLAEDQSSGAAAVILSGTGSDGTRGIRAVKENGGIAMVQDDKSAKFNGMPRSSIATGAADFILPPAQLAEELLNYFRHPLVRRKSGGTTQLNTSEKHLQSIISYLREKTDVDFSHYKESTIIRRLEKRVSLNRFEHVDDYIRFLVSSSREAEILYHDLLIGVTRFFRDSDAFKVLREQIFPSLFERTTGGNSPRSSNELRIWVVGCSSGEEVYSLAIELYEFMLEREDLPSVKIFATDIDEKSLETAAAGIYPESIITDLDSGRTARFFSRVEQGFQIKEIIRSMVIFARHNILKDPPFSNIDLISCRNLLIYFKTETQRRTLAKFYTSLTDTGCLFLGSSESIGTLADGFQTIDAREKVFRKKPGRTIAHEDTFFSGQTYTGARNRFQLHSAESYYQPMRRRSTSFENLVDELLSEFIPPSVIVDSTDSVVHTIHNVSRFAALPPGQVSLNLMQMVPKELSVIVSSLLRRLRRSPEVRQLQFDTIALPQVLEPDQALSLLGKKLTDRKTNDEYIMISFVVSEIIRMDPGKLRGAKSGDSTGSTDILHPVNISLQYQEHIQELERELQHKSENLQAAVEELETSNEELQSSNEELIASNEELQSTNEELQSVNEELYTVNAELQSKIEELTELNTDMNNLMKTSQVGTLFLDSQLIIRKFNEVAAETTGLMNSDIGRPLKHLSFEQFYPEFKQEAAEVLELLRLREHEVLLKDGTWFLIRMVPYRTQQGAADGIVISFFNITSLKQSQQQVERGSELLHKVISCNPVPSVVVNTDGRLVFANEAAETLLDIKNGELGRKTFDDPVWQITDLEDKPIPSSSLPFSLILRTAEPVSDYRHYLVSSGKKMLISVNGTPMFEEAPDKKVSGAVFTLHRIGAEQ